MNWNSLFSGFLGSVIGAAIASIVTFFTAKWQMKNSIKLQINWEKKRFKEKSFARGASREQMQECVKMGVELDDFLVTCLTAMQKIAPQLGL